MIKRLLIVILITIVVLFFPLWVEYIFEKICTPEIRMPLVIKWAFGLILSVILFIVIEILRKLFLYIKDGD